MANLYPEAGWLANGGRNADGMGWGPLPDLNRGAAHEQIRLVFHTTESNNLPSYNGGLYAPHLSYLPGNRTWIQHGYFSRRMGTLVGSTTTGVLQNEISVQVEIVCYSDKALAEKRGHLWVGDLSDDNYADLAAFVAWARDHVHVPYLKLTKAYGPSKDFDSFTYGLNDVTEMAKEEWLDAGGILTAHGASPGQAHWDTGVLDLWRIIEESLPKPSPDLEELEETALWAVKAARVSLNRSLELLQDIRDLK